jgi:hypothetical protein
VCATSQQAYPSKVAQLQQWRDTLDPFELSRRIEQKLERIFQLGSSTVAKDISDPQLSRFPQPLTERNKDPKKKE